MYKATNIDTDKAFQAIVDMQCKQAKKSEREANILRECNKAIDKGNSAKAEEILQSLLNEKGD